GILVATWGADAEQLFLDDVGDLADAALEDGAVLEDGRLDRLIAVQRSEAAAVVLEAPEHGHLGWQQVTGAARRLKLGHGARLASVTDASSRAGATGAPPHRLIVLPFLRRLGGRFIMPGWLAITIWRW